MSSTVGLHDSLSEILDRHPAMAMILLWMEQREDWVVSREMVTEFADMVMPVMLEAPPEIDREDARLTATILNGLSASMVMMMIDWIDGNPGNDIGRIFLSREANVSDSFRIRLRHMLALFNKFELLSLFFTPEHRRWIQRHLTDTE